MRETIVRDKWHGVSKNTHRILLGISQSFDRVIKVSSLPHSLAILLLVPLRSCLAKCMKQRPRSGPKVVGLVSTCSHVWLKTIAILPTAVCVPMLAHCLGVGVSASDPVRKEIRVAPFLPAYAHIVYVAHLSREERRLMCFTRDVKLVPCSH